VRTRLELLLRTRRLRPAQLARVAHYSRQHLLKVRLGTRPSPRCQAAIVAALLSLADPAFGPEEVFEPLGVPIAALLPRTAKRLRPKSGHGRRMARGEPRTAEALARTLGELDAAAFAAWTSEILTTRGTPTETAVRMLLDVAVLLLDRQPAQADRLNRAAIELTRQLPDTPPLLLAALRGYAEKGRANALRMQGQYRDALLVLVDAEQSFLDAEYCALELGHVRYTRATVLFKMERWTDAATAAEQARQMFAAEHDRMGALHAQVIQGCILVERGELDTARGLFLALRKPLETAGDEATLARLWMNLGACDLKRRDAFSARHWLNRATAVFRTRKMASEVIRARWCGAKVSLLEGKRTRGLRELRAAMAEFQNLAMPLDAGFVGIDLLAELVGDPGAQAETLALGQTLASLFLEAGAAVSAAHAIQFLRDAVAGSTATVGLVQYVRRYVRRSEIFPEAPFAPTTGGPT
jgi:tetratricopeptide (TPR) repeat protein